MSAAYLLIQNYSTPTGNTYICPESVSFGTCLLVEMGDNMFSLPSIILVVVTLVLGLRVLFNTKLLVAKVILSIVLLVQVVGYAYVYTQYQQAAQQYEDALRGNENTQG
tara:strand:+ start:1239 stop:1565 length:327 start_codon:yes stop_codon:yes gene_type:complete